MRDDTGTPVSSSSLGQKLSRLSIHCALRVADYSVGFIALLMCSRPHLSPLRAKSTVWIFLFIVHLWLCRFTPSALGCILALGGESFATSQNLIFSKPCVSSVSTVTSLLLISSGILLSEIQKADSLTSRALPGCADCLVTSNFTCVHYFGKAMRKEGSFPMPPSL